MLLDFLISHQEHFFELNPNLLETNLVNIFLLLALLFYDYKTGFRNSLERRQREILQIFELAQEDVKLATESYITIEKSFEDLFLCLIFSKNQLYQEKRNFLETTYQDMSFLLEKNFDLLEVSVENIQKKAFLSLQSSLIIISISQILREFFSLSPEKQSQLLQTSLSELKNLEKKVS